MNLHRRPLHLLTALACCTAAMAQTSTTSGALRGVISAKGSGPVAGASVTIRNRETGLARSLVTGAQGEYSFVLLPVGPYQVTVQAKGLKTLENAAVRVELGQATNTNFTLDRAEAGATVEVVAAVQGLDATQVTNMVSIDENLVQNIPLNGRNFTDLVRLTPGAVTGDQGRQLMEGGRGIMNNLTIDGASYNSTFYGEQRAGTAIPFAFGLDTVRELQIITDAYDPQYGDAAGGIINAVSKTGGNQFSGSVMEQFRPSSMVALMKPVPYPTSAVTNTTGSRTRDFSQNQYNFNVGGPIRIPHVYNGTDRTFFYGAWEGQRFNQGQVVESSIPTALNQAGDFSQTVIGSDSNNQPILANN